jgi:hypothetical protein
MQRSRLFGRYHNRRARFASCFQWVSDCKCRVLVLDISMSQARDDEGESMITIEQLHWIAGILEGEGTFCFHPDKKNPACSSIRVCLSMTDQDVVYKLANILGFGSMHAVKGNSRPGTLQHRWGCSGINAAGLMMTLYSLMGKRRQAKIRELLAFYRTKKPINLNRRRDDARKTFDPSFPHFSSFKRKTTEERKTMNRETRQQWKANHPGHHAAYMRAYRERKRQASFN